MPKRILSGITPTGDMTLGNYIGAIKNFVKLQDEYDMYIFVADLHALTINTPPMELRKNTKNVMALYIACGLDTNKVKLFVQSDILEHANLGHILLTKTTLGELSKMTQFKAKSQVHSNGTEFIPTGILTYPTLMAADILLYSPDFVPTGQDQKQHIELTRNIAIRFNNAYGETFKVPEALIPEEGSKIMSLTNPNEKMSKSSTIEKSLIRLLDDPEKAFKKIMSAITDSENKVFYDPANKTGISNLLTIYAGLKNIKIKEAEKECKDFDYKVFKNLVATTVKNFLIDIQAKYAKTIDKVEEIRTNGAKSIQPIASKKLMEIKNKLGLN